MKKERVLRVVGLLLLAITLLLAACGGGATEAMPEETSGSVPTSSESDMSSEDDDGAEQEADEPEADEPEATATPENQVPDSIVVHPDAMNLEIDLANNTYVYIVPMMVQETTDYLLVALEEKGWEPLGQPTVMGHLATINMQQEDLRLSISMQDNERSETTRVQMLLLEQ